VARFAEFSPIGHFLTLVNVLNFDSIFTIGHLSKWRKMGWAKLWAIFGRRLCHKTSCHPVTEWPWNAFKNFFFLLKSGHDCWTPLLSASNFKKKIIDHVFIICSLIQELKNVFSTDLSKYFSSYQEATEVGYKQGDHIGRIFAKWEIVCLLLLHEN
jgi:hypothetical protein